MKSIWIIVFLLLIIGSCYKDVFDKDGFYGNCKAKVNGIQWNGNCLVIKAVPACSPDSCISLSFWNFDKNDNLISKIGIQQVQLKKGKFYLTILNPGLRIQTIIFFIQNMKLQMNDLKMLTRFMVQIQAIF